MKNRAILFLTFVLFSSFCMYTQEKNDLSLFEIDRLIRKTEYDEALKQLNIYIQNRPENFDNAQTRIKRIMNARKQYSILAEKLIDLIQTDPGNNKEIYEITAQLEKFEKHPSDQNLQFIADLKKSAEFNYFRALFLDIQNATAEYTHKEQYVASIEKAKEGFWLYKDNFDERWEDVSEISQPVAAILADLTAQINSYEEKNFISRINDAINDFVKTVGQEQYELATEKFEALKVSMTQLYRIRESIMIDGMKMQEKFQEIQNIDEDTTDASFLPFMIRFVYGVDSVPDSGILGAIDYQWNKMTGKMNDAVFAVLKKNYEHYSVAVDEKYVGLINNYVSLEQKVLNLYELDSGIAYSSLEVPSEPLINPYANYITSSEYIKNLAKQTVAINKTWSQILNTEKNQEKLLSEIKSYDSTEEKSVVISALYNINENIGPITGLYENQILESYDWAQAYQLLNENHWDGLTQEYETTLNLIFTKADELKARLWNEITEYYRTVTDDYYSQALGYNKSAENYTNGFFTKISSNVLAELNRDISKARIFERELNADPELDFGINYSYPDLAIKIINYNQKQIDSYVSSITSYQQIINNNYAKTQISVEQNEIDNLIKNTIEYLDVQKNRLADLKNASMLQITLAQNRIVASQLARNEADIRYREAQNALRSEDFDTARRKLQDALTKYDEALNNQNDEQLRSECDEKLQDLGERIAKAENEIVVREVRELKTLAKDAYFNGRFDDAEKYLNQAKTRWAITNVEEDEEITNLFNFVNTAISMKDGRDILPSAPQYPEMSQLLNVSYQYFDEGSRKIGEGDKTGGFEDLDLALESIQKLQYVYPLNQEAALLTLRISRLKDPGKFKEEFAQRIETAKMMCKSTETRQQGYANLLDYYQLEPDYKGLKDLIYQIEIDIGIRQKPVDNSASTRARNLITEAQSIYRSAGSDEKKLQSALAKLDQALSLVSDNKTAIALKDEITTKIGGTTSTVLSTEDERLYQLAIQRLQNNNVVGANAIVEQLLKKKNNANSQKIKDLKNKIEARS